MFFWPTFAVELEDLSNMNMRTTKRGTFVDEYGGEYGMDGKTLYHFRQTSPDMTTYEVKDGCEVIGRMAFKNSSLLEIHLPDSVTIIRDQAFFGCTQLRRLNIPKSLTVFEMEHSPFPSSFSELYGSSEHFITEDGILYNADRTEVLLCYTSREEIKLPINVKKIAQQAFANRQYMTAILLPDSLESIGEAAFMGCTGLTSIDITHTVSSIGKQCFWGCHALQEVKLPKTIKEIMPFCFFSCDLREITLPDGLKKIGEHAFGGNFSLKSVHIPNSVRSIGISAFEKCESLKKALLPERLVTIERSLFEGCRGLRSIDVPSSVRRIKSRAFADIEGITVNINKGQTVIISEDAFEDENCLCIKE